MIRPRNALAVATIGLALLNTGCAEIEVGALPLRDDFSDCGEYTNSDEVATVDCPDDQLRVLVSKPNVSPIHYVPMRFDARPKALTVSADVRAPVPGGMWGIGCLASGPGEAARGYALLVGRSGEAGIVRIDEDAYELAPLAEKDEGFVVKPARRHKLRLRCVRTAPQTVQLRASIDRGRPITALDCDGISPFSAALPMVVTDRPRTDVRFDNVSAGEVAQPSSPSKIVRVDQLYSVAVNGRGLRRISTAYVKDAEPVMSPDGKRIAFISERAGEEYDIYVMSPNGTGLARLTDNPAGDFDPAWSPDSRRIAFSSERTGDSEIYVMKRDGTGLVRLTKQSSRDENPSWSPDGGRIAFWSDRDGDREIYVMQADGTRVKQLTSNDIDEDYWPAWSPGGRLIAFTSDRDLFNDIYVMRTDGSGVRRLTKNEVNDDEWPAWSADGRRIAFNSDRAGYEGIYVMNADGTAPRRVVGQECGDANDPSWAPDGRILFDSDRRIFRR